MTPRIWYLRVNATQAVDSAFATIPVDLAYLQTVAQDTEINLLYLTVVQNGEVMSFPSNAYVEVKIDKPDATEWISTGEILESGQIKINLPYQAVVAIGVAHINVKVFTDTQILTIPPFQIRIIPDPNADTNGDIESTSEYPILTDLINEYTGSLSNMDIVEGWVADPNQFIGPQGPQGIQGEIGPHGIQGIKGDKGDKGDIGPEGPKGEQGIQGFKGDTGDTGPRGLQGERGMQGLKGDVGLQGEIGPRGPQGEIGPRGFKGDTGPEGPQGIRGLTGPEGPEGPEGPKGDKGDKGDIGPTGDIGPQGEQGIQGIQGLKGETGPKGDTGAKGDKGDKGNPFIYTDFTPLQLTNLKGAKGDKGDKGDQGIGVASVSDVSETLFTVNLTNNTSHSITKPPSYNYSLNVTTQYEDESQLPAISDLGNTVLVGSNLYIYTLNGWYNAGNLTTVYYDINIDGGLFTDVTFINIDGGLFTDVDGGVDIGIGSMAALEEHIVDPYTHNNIIIDGN